MAASSEAKRAANRENAKKSTGPKTNEGKERSRANAFKHGLTGAGIVTAESLKTDVRLRIDEWVTALMPRTGPERWLIERAAVDSTRVDSAVVCERAIRAAKMRNDQMHGNAEMLEEARIAQVGNQLFAEKSDRRALVATLRASSKGCEWLASQWEILARSHQALGFWDLPEYQRAELLLGETADDTLIARRYAALIMDYLTNREDGWKDVGIGSDAGARLNDVNLLFLNVWKDAMNTDYLELVEPHAQLRRALDRFGWKKDEFLSPDDRPEAPDSRVRASARLRAFIDGQIAELRERGEELAAIAAIDAAEASQRGLVDLSPEAMLLNRYENELCRRVERSLREFERLRKSRSDEAAAPAVETPPVAKSPAPPPRNEPTVAPKSSSPNILPPPPPLPSPFRDGGSRPMPVQLPITMLPDRR